MGDVVRYRLGWRQLPWPVVLILSGPYVSPPGPRTAADNLAYLAVYLTGSAAVLLLARFRRGCDLRPDGLVRRGVLRSRLVPWPDIASIEPRRMLRQHYVQVLAAGELLTLPAPTRAPFLAPDPDFETKVDTLLRYWVAHRGAGWTPPAAAAWWPAAAPST